VVLLLLLLLLRAALPDRQKDRLLLHFPHWALAMRATPDACRLSVPLSLLPVRSLPTPYPLPVFPPWSWPAAAATPHFPDPSTTLPRPRSAILGPAGYRRACGIPERSLALPLLAPMAGRQGVLGQLPASRVQADAALYRGRTRCVTNWSPWRDRWQANAALQLARSQKGELKSSQLVVHGHSGAHLGPSA